MANRALIVGVGDYPAGISPLPAVKFDVTEIGRLLGSGSGAFATGNIEALADRDATASAIRNGLSAAFGNADADDTLFVYMAGHGTLQGTDYYFIPHDCRPMDLAGTAIPLHEIKTMFDSSPSHRVLLWLDFCHSGGILARGIDAEGTANEAIARTLSVTQGAGKVIMCACTASQLAYESVNHGHFTKYLVDGLRGAAANAAGEITANSLHDYIDQQMGSAQQRPMFFGKQTGRIVLMHSRSVLPNQQLIQPATAEDVVVSDSGEWVMLGEITVQAASVKQSTDGDVTVVIPSSGSAADARIRALKPEHSWGTKSIEFAHRNDGFYARVIGIESESTAAGAAWTVKIKPEAVEYGGGFIHDAGLQENNRSYSADDIAELRARRLLLGEKLERTRAGDRGSMLEHFVEGMGTEFAVTDSIFTRFVGELQSNPNVGMKKARLAAIFALKASQIFEHVVELRLGPVSDGKLHVVCEGRRRDRYANRQPTVLRIEGDYVLTPTTV
jgi:hypothetical protein